MHCGWMPWRFSIYKLETLAIVVARRLSLIVWDSRIHA